MSKNRLSIHDRYVRSLMTNKKTIREFFEANLPSHIKDSIDFESIEPRRESFIDDKLKLQIADLLYSVNVKGRQGYFYLLVEHMSSQDKMLPYRMLKYMIGIMENHLSHTKDKTLPFIYPIVMYTGSKPYRYSLDLFDLFKDNKDLAKETFFSPYSLLDLTQSSDEDLKKYIYFGTMALMTKYIHNEDILPILKDVIYLLKEIENQGDLEYIYGTITYIVESGAASNKQEFTDTIKKLESIDEEKLMTILEQFEPDILKRGIEKGKTEGRVEFAHEIAFEMLKEGEPLSKISKYSGLSLSEIKKLKSQIH